MLKPEILDPWLAQNDFLPTEIPIGKGLISNKSASSLSSSLSPFNS